MCAVSSSGLHALFVVLMVILIDVELLCDHTPHLFLRDQVSSLAAFASKPLEEEQRANITL